MKKTLLESKFKQLLLDIYFLLIEKNAIYCEVSIDKQTIRLSDKNDRTLLTLSIESTYEFNRLCYAIRKALSKVLGEIPQYMKCSEAAIEMNSIGRERIYPAAIKIIVNKKYGNDVVEDCLKYIEDNPDMFYEPIMKKITEPIKPNVKKVVEKPKQYSLFDESYKIIQQINEVLRLAGCKNLLNEGVNDTYQKQYSGYMTKDEFNNLLKLDPTYQGNNTPGKFFLFIMKMAKPIYHNRKLPNEPKWKEYVLEEDLYKLTDLLKGYMIYRTDSLVNDNINYYLQPNGIAKLATDINKAKNKDIPVNKQAETNYRVFRKAVELGGLDVVYEDNNWLIGKLTSYKSSNCFDRPITEWCTAHNKDYYDEYMEEYSGYYYVHLNKNTGELYQLHIESNQFKGRNDEEVDQQQFIQQNPQLKNFYLQIGCGNNYYMWDLIDTNKITEEMMLEAVKQNGRAIQYIKNPSEEIKLEAVKQNGYVIRAIDNPSEEVQLEAVRQTGYAIEYIKNPTEKVQLEAVKQNGWAIQFIDNPSEQVQLEVVKENGYAIQFIDNPSEQVQLEVVKENGYAIKYINNPSEQVQLEAVKQNGWAIDYIVNPTSKVKTLQKKLWG